jgi:hypothetical protein
MTHAQAVAAGKKAARTRWGPDGKKGTPKSRAKKHSKAKGHRKGKMTHAQYVAAGQKAARTKARNKRGRKKK